MNETDPATKLAEMSVRRLVQLAANAISGRFEEVVTELERRCSPPAPGPVPTEEERLTVENAELERENARLADLRYLARDKAPHQTGADCPTWYDGQCGCTVPYLLRVRAERDAAEGKGSWAVAELRRRAAEIRASGEPVSAVNELNESADRIATGPAGDETH